jgi:hypothetical protein
MMLRDGQVRKLMVDKTIMEYNITVHQIPLSDSNSMGTSSA